MKTSVSCDYVIDGYKLQWSNCTRDLGVHMDIDLKFTEHISTIVHIGLSRAAFVSKSYPANDPEVLVKASCTYVRPILKCCTPVCGHHPILDLLIK